MGNIDKDELLRHITITAVASRYAEVKRVGSEYVTLCPWHNDTKPSLTIYTGKHGQERCHCFACGAGGNVIDYYMQQTGEDFKAAIQNLAQGVLTGAAAKPLVAKDKPIKPAEWQAAKPPKGQVPKLTHHEFGEPEGVWCFRDADGDPLFYEARYLRTDEDGELRKEPRCLTWGRLSANTPYKWSARHWPSPRPLYGLDQVAKFDSTASIVVFEGPRKAEAAQMLLKVPCVSWAAGAKAWRYSDWDIAKGRKLILFPDNDAAGKAAMQELAAHLYKVGAESVHIVQIPIEKPEKWDICDEAGLTADSLKAMLKNRTEAKAMATVAAAAREAREVIQRVRYSLDISKVPHDDGGTIAVEEPEAEGLLTGDPPIEAYEDSISYPNPEPYEPPTLIEGECGAWDPDVPPEGVLLSELSDEALGVDAVSGVENSSADALPYTDDPMHWPEPEDILLGQDERQINPDYLPEIIKHLAFLKARPTGGDPGAIALSMLCASAAAIHDGIKLYPDRHASWSESARIWVALVGNPSAKKTFCADYATRPLVKADSEILPKIQQEVRMYKIAEKRYEKNLDEWYRLEEEGNNTKPMPVLPRHPEIPRYYLSNTTIEALQEALRYTDRGTLIFYDELSGWMSMGQYKSSAGGDKADWLMTYNGGTQRIDRIGRGSFVINNFSCCVLGGIQPDTVAKIAERLEDNGLLARFYIAHVPAAEPGNPPTMEEAREINHYEKLYTDMIRHFLQTVPDGTRIEMSPEAREITLSAFRRFHRLTRHDSYGKRTSAAIAKFEGGIHRMCLIYHCIDAYMTQQHPSSFEVSAETAHKVIRLYQEYILPNMISFYGNVLGDDTRGNKYVKRAANYLLAKNLSSVTLSDLRNYGGLKHAEMYIRKEVLSQLSEAGWVRASNLYIDSVSKMPKRFDVNPLIHLRFKDHAETERKRLRESIEAMRAVGMKVGRQDSDR